VAFRILLVDDDTDLIDTLARLLRRFSHTCLMASSAEQAIDLIQIESPQLVVTDLHMPGMDGLAIARFAREKTPPIPVILMTAYPTPESDGAARMLGDTLHLRKPFANAEFLKLVQDALIAPESSQRISSDATGGGHRLARLNDEPDAAAIREIRAGPDLRQDARAGGEPPSQDRPRKARAEEWIGGG
jgi:CheY-like chemotaxis protein